MREQRKKSYNRKNVAEWYYDESSSKKSDLNNLTKQELLIG